MTTDWNTTDKVFTDISVEAERTYHFGYGQEITVDEPTHLHVSETGGHRLLTAAGKGVYIPAGFIGITWTVKAGSPTFVA